MGCTFSASPNKEADVETVLDGRSFKEIQVAVAETKRLARLTREAQMRAQLTEVLQWTKNSVQAYIDGDFRSRMLEVAQSGESGSRLFVGGRKRCACAFDATRDVRQLAEELMAENPNLLRDGLVIDTVELDDSNYRGGPNVRLRVFIHVSITYAVEATKASAKVIGGDGESDGEATSVQVGVPVAT
jgi:hypothetical protein